MQFGLSIVGDLQQPAGVDMARRFEEAIVRVRLAREMGFSSVSMGQHYVNYPFQHLQNIPALARIAAEVPGMDLGATSLLPLHSPVDVAEQFATLDIISKGHAALNAAIGYRDEEYHAFQVARRDRVGRFVECLEIVKRLWTEEVVTFHGKHYHYENVRLTLKPVQKPHIPITIGANADAAVQRAARLGYPWSINPHATLDTIKRQVELYRQAAEEVGNPVPLHHMSREVWVADDRETAWEEAAPYLGGKYDAYAQWGQDKALPGQESFRIPFAELAKGRFIIGSPQDCIEQIKRCEELGISRFSAGLRWPAMPLQLSIKGMYIFAEKVMPHFR